MFGLVGPCERDACFCQRDSIRLQSPVLVDGKYPMMHFKDSGEYFDWFFTLHPNGKGIDVFMDFIGSGGCGSWLLDWPEAEDFSEWATRYRASKLGIAPAANFDDAPARLLEALLIIESEINSASQEKARRDASK